MKNSILNFEREVIDNISVTDYKTLDLDSLRDLLNNKSYLKYIELKYNDLIENVSYKYYKNSAYWDLLLVMNNRDALFDMVYNFDTVVDIIDEITENYFRKDYQGKVSEQFIEWYKENKKIKISNLNENNVILFILKDEILSEVIRNIKYGI
nr:MAG TPA: hypothetical protein [Caudoviricetes sp.]